MMAKQNKSFTDKKILIQAIRDSFTKLDPRIQLHNPVMLLVYVAAAAATVLWVGALFGIGDTEAAYTGAIAVILWFTVVFANFAEALAEGRGKAQADTLRSAKKDVPARVLEDPQVPEQFAMRPSSALKKGDFISVVGLF